MQVLVVEPFYGGSHRAFLDGWRRHSRHNWTVVGFPAHHWKWRMRHAALSAAEEVSAAAANGSRFDLVLASDMLNLAEFKGLAAQTLRSTPSVVYFHENQLTYPARDPQERDLHFGFTNFTSAVAADAVWFNSEYHRGSFLEALAKLLGVMPDYDCREQIGMIRAKSAVFPQGIERMPERPERRPGPTRLLWAARWEFDKNPELFFRALYRLKEQQRGFRLSVIGERFPESPGVFEEARAILGEHVDRWGYLESRDEYVRTLLDSDIVVSTADHEFFGVSMVEAAAAGCYPLVPQRLAYPELFGPARIKGGERFFYDGTLADLVEKLSALIESVEAGTFWGDDPNLVCGATQRFWWEKLAPRLDDALDDVISRRR